MYKKIVNSEVLSISPNVAERASYCDISKTPNITTKPLLWRGLGSKQNEPFSI